MNSYINEHNLHGLNRSISDVRSLNLKKPKFDQVIITMSAITHMRSYFQEKSCPANKRNVKLYR